MHTVDFLNDLFSLFILKTDANPYWTRYQMRLRALTYWEINLSNTFYANAV